jgi:hypothetical protein
MTDKQPEALRLANAIDLGRPRLVLDCIDAAAELRRLHEVNAELVEALKNAAEEIESWGAYASPYFQNKHDLAGSVAAVHAVIAKATGEQQ